MPLLKEKAIEHPSVMSPSVTRFLNHPIMLLINLPLLVPSGRLFFIFISCMWGRAVGVLIFVWFSVTWLVLILHFLWYAGRGGGLLVRRFLDFAAISLIRTDWTSFWGLDLYLLGISILNSYFVTWFVGIFRFLFACAVVWLGLCRNIFSRDSILFVLILWGLLSCLLYLCG